jgi:hypothetical protein
LRPSAIRPTLKVCQLIALWLQALKNLITETDLILETTPDLPENRTACRENLRAALASEMTSSRNRKMTLAAIMGSKGGSAKSATRGPEHFRKMGLARKTRGGGYKSLEWVF